MWLTEGNDHKSFAELYAEYWRELGLNVDIYVTEESLLTASMNANEIPMRIFYCNGPSFWPFLDWGINIWAPMYNAWFTAGGESADGEFLGCPDRAAGYNSNIWECRANFSYFADHHYTYYFPVPREMCGKEFKIHILGLDEENKKYGVNVYLCDDKTEVTGIETDVEF